MTTEAGPWTAGGRTCLEEFGDQGFVFSVPTYGFANGQLRLENADGDDLWLNYNDGPIAFDHAGFDLRGRILEDPDGVPRRARPGIRSPGRIGRRHAVCRFAWIEGMSRNLVTPVAAGNGVRAGDRAGGCPPSGASGCRPGPPSREEAIV